MDKKQRKWTLEEIDEIIDFLRENPKIEQPTAQIYYRKFLSKSHINATWNLVKWKVRYLKKTFAKAQDLKNAADAGLIEDNLIGGIFTLEDKINKICPQFDKLEQIFCHSLTFCVKETEQTSATFNNKVIPEKKLKRSAQEEAVSGSTREHVLRMKRMKHELEREFQTEELNFQKEKLKLEHALEIQKILLKKMEFEKDERIKQLEIESKERIALYELDLKYKSLNN